MVGGRPFARAWPLVVAGVGWAVLRDDTYVAPTPRRPPAAIEPGEAAGALRPARAGRRRRRPRGRRRARPRGRRGRGGAAAGRRDNARAIGVDRLHPALRRRARRRRRRGRLVRDGRDQVAVRGLRPLRVGRRRRVRARRRAAAGPRSPGSAAPTGAVPGVADRSGPGASGRRTRWSVGGDRTPPATAGWPGPPCPWCGGCCRSGARASWSRCRPAPTALDAALGAEPGQYAAIAAVTSGVGDDLDPGVPVHVLVNPDVFGDLDGQGAQVVMSHEATHVATEAATEPDVVPPG